MSFFPLGIPLGVGLLGLLCLTQVHHCLRPDVNGPIHAFSAVLDPRLLTRDGRRLWALGWSCVLFCDVLIWWKLWLH
jgi:hypothetical protein